ncbi:serine hydrolase [Planctomicrobium sp. SH664]|uniref:serine hydrolase n=1 Tax=Planctomicrobium sp. SH664 TaxID=3448125 RepID=UPI003F5BE2D3
MPGLSTLSHVSSSGCSLRNIFLAAVLWNVVAGTAPAAPFQWESATPESQHASSEKLQALRDAIAPTSANLLVVQNDRIIFEWYGEGRTPEDRHYTASLAKAIVAGLATAAAIDEGLLNLDDPVSKFVPQWRNDPLKSRITLRQLGSHTSGLDDANSGNVPHRDLEGWRGEFWKNLEPPRDPFTISRDDVPVLFEPGTQYHYSNPGIAMLTYAVTAALQSTKTPDVRTLLNTRIMEPIGVTSRDWSIGYGKTVTVDGLPLVGSWGGAAITPRALARIGRLIAQGGQWEGRQLISPQALAAVTTDAGTPGNAGIGWWTNADQLYPDLPGDAIWGSGAGHQVLFIVPSLNLIAVRNGSVLAEGEHAPVLVNQLFDPLLAAVSSKPSSAAASGRKIPKWVHQPLANPGPAPYPPSEVITGVEWAPVDSIRREANGSDNWPMTWARDGELYSAYGDGKGFKPYVKEKLSVGFVKVTGGPDDFTGINVRTPTLEEPGDGPKGKKVSGLLSVEGVIYLIARNAGNSQLAWSSDLGQSWTWAPWKWTESMGCPTFLNFGQDYAGARDGYVYVYSMDSETAYDNADGYLLARVPKDRIRDANAYEYFVNMNGQQPQWSRDFRQRGHVFSFPGRCYRSGITYNAPLKRYLWYIVQPESTDSRGPRYQGGMGIYDAPEPWGPWTTVDFTNDWDVGPGETGCFPSKWISDDGKEMALVFSGDDHFSVRKLRLKTR